MPVIFRLFVGAGFDLASIIIIYLDILFVGQICNENHKRKS